MAKSSYLAVDMGASSGRHILGQFDGERIELGEVYRYFNGPIEMNDGYYWNLPGLWADVRAGLMAAAERCGDTIKSVGVDTWGVDYAFLDKNGQILANPRCYRDPRTDGALERAFQVVSRDEIFERTGLQFMQINTLYQLLADRRAGSVPLANAERFMMMPDLFHWLLSGVPSNEFTNSTTTQFYDPREGDWAYGLLKKFDLPTEIFKPVSLPGTILGGLRPSLVKESGLASTKVVLPGSHDTASAVMAVPTASTAGTTDWAYISLGTWALMGIESAVPIVNDVVSTFNFTNEGGVGGTTRILKNICGMWLLQECRRVWNTQGKGYDWEEMKRLTAGAAPLRSFINPDARDFLTPTDMPEAIRAYTARTGQPVPDDDGAIMRVALDSLAMKFRQVKTMCEKISGQTINTIHIVGGGVRNTLLCQAAADATGCCVVTGPIEATALGNLLVQVIASGELSSMSDARAVVRASFANEMITYYPRDTHQWDDAYERFLSCFEL